MALTDISHPTDIAMLTDLYELTMAQGLWESGKANEQGCFTAFYRDHPFGSAYAVMCGTAELPELVENLRFTPEDIDYLASLQAPAGGAMFKPAFLDYLRDFRAHVNIDAVPEGELVFPREPMVRVAILANGRIADMPDELDQLLKVLQATFDDPNRRPQGKLVLGFRKEWLAELESHLVSYELRLLRRICG